MTDRDPEFAKQMIIDPIWGQITDNDRMFLTGVARALLAARAKYPGNGGRYVALTGEAGEADL